MGPKTPTTNEWNSKVNNSGDIIRMLSLPMSFWGPSRGLISFASLHPMQSRLLYPVMQFDSSSYVSILLKSSKYSRIFRFFADFMRIWYDLAAFTVAHHCFVRCTLAHQTCARATLTQKVWPPSLCSLLSDSPGTSIFGFSDALAVDPTS
jgi:hypothetical protein